MSKIIALRGKPDTVAVFYTYGKLSGKQDISRSQSMADIVRYVAGLPLSEDTKLELKIASKITVDVSSIEAVPAFIKISIDVTDEEWDTAMRVFMYAFDLKRPPQMPYFVKVAGNAAIKKLQQDNAELGIVNTTEDAIDIDVFKELSTDDKLVQIYRLLLQKKE